MTLNSLTPRANNTDSLLDNSTIAGINAANQVLGGIVGVARMQYEDLGFDTLPVISGEKRPWARHWQSRFTNCLWQYAPEDANIGVRGGGLADVAIIDCDESRTFETVTNWLAGLGYLGDSYPVVQTASGVGRHIYITLAGMLPGDARKLSSKTGAGEFRYGPGAFVVAPPSVLKDGSGYALIGGDFSVRPKLEVNDILPILGNRNIASVCKLTLSRNGLALLHGKNIDNYKSRSEAEQALIASMVNAGFSFPEVLDLFNRHPCAGKYAELKARNTRNAERWLRKSYNEAVQWTQTHESKGRQLAKLAITWAESKAWPGRTGAVDRLIYIALAQIMHKAGRITFAASCRDLAEQAGVSHMTADRATRRLCNSGLLILEKRAVVDSANIYKLSPLNIPLHSPSTQTVRRCNTLSTHDIFRFRGLGKSAGEVYVALQECPATINELAQKTGRHVRTIKRVIKRMAKLANPFTGEYLPMVASDDGRIFHSRSVDFDQIAHVIGTAGMGERQRKEHAKERRQHDRELGRCRDKQTAHNQR